MRSLPRDRLERQTMFSPELMRGFYNIRTPSSSIVVGPLGVPNTLVGRLLRKHRSQNYKIWICLQIYYSQFNKEVKRMDLLIHYCTMCIQHVVPFEDTFDHNPVSSHWGQVRKSIVS